MKVNLLARGFPIKLIRRSIDMATTPRLASSEPRKTTAIPLILAFDPRKRNLNTLVSANKPLLSTDSMGKRFEEEYHMMVTYRRPRNLKDILVHSDFQTKTKTKPGM